MIGNWNVKLSTGLPEKVATAVSEIALVGAEYTPIAYLGSQIVNGINHAVLAEQLLTVGRDQKNVVILIFNERSGQIVLTNIERVVEGGSGLGGAVIDISVKEAIPQEARDVFDHALSNFVGTVIKPFALLATQIVRGTNYVFLAETIVVDEKSDKNVVLVTINDYAGTLSFAEIFSSGLEKSLGCPLGEWP